MCALWFAQYFSGSPDQFLLMLSLCCFTFIEISSLPTSTYPKSSHPSKVKNLFKKLLSNFLRFSLVSGRAEIQIQERRQRERERETETERDRQTAKSVLLTVRSIKTEIQSGTLGFYLCFRIWRQYSEPLV